MPPADEGPIHRDCRPPPRDCRLCALPDDLIHIIFQNLRDARWLSSCLASCRELRRLGLMEAHDRAHAKGYPAVSPGRLARIERDEARAELIVIKVSGLYFPARSWTEFGLHKAEFKRMLQLDELVLRHQQSPPLLLLRSHQTREAALYNVSALGSGWIHGHLKDILLYLEDGEPNAIRAAALCTRLLKELNLKHLPVLELHPAATIHPAKSARDCLRSRKLACVALRRVDVLRAQHEHIGGARAHNSLDPRL